MASVKNQRLVGIAICIVCILATRWILLNYIDSGVIYIKFSFAMPLFAVVGLTIALFPVSKESMLERYGVEKPQRLDQIPKRLWAAIIAGCVAGLVFIYLLKKGILAGLFY